MVKASRRFDVAGAGHQDRSGLGAGRGTRACHRRGRRLPGPGRARRGRTPGGEDLSRLAKRRLWLRPPSGSSRRRRRTRHRRSDEHARGPDLLAAPISELQAGSERAAWTSSPRCRRRRAAASRVASTVTTGEAACGPGSVDGSFGLEVRDTTVKQIAGRPDWAVKQTFDAAQASAAGAAGLNPGESFSVAVNELFDVLAPGSTVVHSATSSDPLVQVSGVEHPGDGDRGLGRERRRAGHRPGDRRLRRGPPDAPGRGRGRAHRHRRPGLSGTHGRCTMGMTGLASPARMSSAHSGGGAPSNKGAQVGSSRLRGEGLRR